MTYCLNPQCPKPPNPDVNKFCQNCGKKILLDHRFRPLKPISNNSLGRTFLGFDEQEKIPCVIKQFLSKNDEISQFRQQINQIQKISQHPQIPDVYAYFEFPDYQCLVQQFIKGESLAQKITKQGAFSEIEIREILTDILPVLNFIHQNNIIHRDINPDNIILSDHNLKLYLVDFGAVKVTSKTSLAKTGTLIGSVGYAPPEQLRGKPTFSSDIYSLGVTCIHLLTNIHPFELFNDWEDQWVWNDFLLEPVGKKLKEVLNKMIPKTLNQRYNSIEQICNDLQIKLQLPVISAPPQSLNPLPVISPPQQSLNPLPVISAPPQSLIKTWQCVRTLTGHLNSIYALDFNMDGSAIASASADSKVIIWQLENNNFNTISAHSTLVNTVKFSQIKPEFIVSGSWDYSVKIWDRNTLELKQTLPENSSWIKTLVISRDGKYIIIGCADKSIKIWSFEQGLIKTISEHNGAINCLLISKNNQIIISGSDDQTIKIWERETGKLIKTLSGHTDIIESMVLHPSEKILFSGSKDQNIKIWNMETGAMIKSFVAHTDSVKSIIITPDGENIISGSSDTKIKIWQGNNQELLHTLGGHSGGINAIAISPDGKTIASGSQDKTVKLWRFQ